MRPINEAKLKQVLYYIADHPGASLREIMRDCELSSTSVTKTQVDRLVDNGLVTQQWGLCRTIYAVSNFVNSKGERWFQVIDGIQPDKPASKTKEYPPHDLPSYTRKF